MTRRAPAVLGEASVVAPAAVARELGLGRVACSAWLESHGIVRVLVVPTTDGRGVREVRRVVWGDVLAVLRGDRPASSRPATSPARTLRWVDPGER